MADGKSALRDGAMGAAAAAWCFVAASLAATSAPAQPTPSPCHSEAYAAVTYTVCAFDLAAADIRFYWRRADGTPYRTFAALQQDLAGKGLDLAFAINGGMFEEDFSPVGLFVAAGQVQRPLNTASAPNGAVPLPNFYRKPNGVFFIAGKKAGVMTTDAFAKARPKIDFATQSGPMLVIDGTLHPAFIAGSIDRKRRSGVGAKDATHIAFVLSEDAVNFYDFARFFRDRLGIANALFLDGGNAPGIFAPDLARNDRPGDGGYGPIIAAVRPAS